MEGVGLLLMFKVSNPWADTVSNPGIVTFSNTCMKAFVYQLGYIIFPSCIMAPLMQFLCDKECERIMDGRVIIRIKSKEE